MEKSNVLNAIVAIVDHNNNHINGVRSGNLSQSGRGLEEYILRAFSNSFALEEPDYNERLHEVFSYWGSACTPPDAMIRGGVAIEIKKIESASQIQLNSSMPKKALFSSDPMLTEECRNAEEWDKKDIIYAIGVVKNSILRHLFFVYGIDYCPSNSCESLFKQLKESIHGISGLSIDDSNELGRINDIGPLKSAYLRMRAMWVMKTPWKVFNIRIDNRKEFTMSLVVNDDIWGKLLEHSNIDEQILNQKGLSIQNFTIKNPDDCRPVPGKLITYSIP